MPCCYKSISGQHNIAIKQPLALSCHTFPYFFIHCSFCCIYKHKIYLTVTLLSICTQIIHQCTKLTPLWGCSLPRVCCSGPEICSLQHGSLFNCSCITEIYETLNFLSIYKQTILKYAIITPNLALSPSSNGAITV